MEGRISQLIEELSQMKDLYGDILVVNEQDQYPKLEHQDAEDDLVEALVIS